MKDEEAERNEDNEERMWEALESWMILLCVHLLSQLLDQRLHLQDSVFSFLKVILSHEFAKFTETWLRQTTGSQKKKKK